MTNQVGNAQKSKLQRKRKTPDKPKTAVKASEPANDAPTANQPANDAPTAKKQPNQAKKTTPGASSKQPAKQPAKQPTAVPRRRNVDPPPTVKKKQRKRPVKDAAYRERYKTGQENDKGQIICGSKKKRVDEKCQSINVMHNGRCRMHGGASYGGTASPRFANGRTSKYREIGKYASEFHRLRESPDLLIQLDEIAALSVSAGEILQQLGTGDPLPDFPKLKKVYSAMRKAMRAGDIETTEATADGLGALIYGGQETLDSWERYQKTVETQRKLIESERKRAIEAGQMIAVQHAIIALDLVVSSIVDSVQANVKGDRERRRILIDAQNAYHIAMGTGKTKDDD